MTFLAIGIWTHVVFDKDNLGEILGFETRVFVWTSVTLAYVIIHYALLRFSFWLVHIFPRWFHLTPVASLVGILVCEPIFIHIMTHMGVFEPFSMSKIIIFVGRDIIILGLLEFIFATLIIQIVTTLPSHAHFSKRAKDSSANLLNLSHPLMIPFGTHNVSAQDILVIKSEDHYCHLQTAQKTFFERKRLIDIVNILPSTLGMQVHRSFWVAHKFVKGIRLEGQKTVVITKDGQEISASRKLRSQLIELYPKLNED